METHHRLEVRWSKTRRCDVFGTLGRSATCLLLLGCLMTLEPGPDQQSKPDGEEKEEWQSVTG